MASWATWGMRPSREGRSETCADGGRGGNRKRGGRESEREIVSEGEEGQEECKIVYTGTEGRKMSLLKEELGDRGDISVQWNKKRRGQSKMKAHIMKSQIWQKKNKYIYLALNLEIKELKLHWAFI